MSVTVGQLAELVQGTVVGDRNQVVADAATLSEAKTGHISFLENPKHVHLVAESQAAAVLVPAGLEIPGKTVVQVRDPMTSFVAILQHFRGSAQVDRPADIDPRAFVHPSAQLGSDVRIGPFAFVGENCIIGSGATIHNNASIGRNCKLGDDVTVFPNAVLYEGTILGNRVIIHANAVIGGHGFGYRFQQGKHCKVPQLGHVELDDDVEIGACTTVDRGTFHATRIGEGTKIDNLVQIGHNCQVGPHNLFVSQMGMAGSSKTGSHVVVAGQVGIVDHVTIGDRVTVGGQAAVINDVASGKKLLGSPATDEREQKKMLMSLQKLPDMRRDLRRVMQHLGLDDKEERLAS